MKKRILALAMVTALTISAFAGCAKKEAAPAEPTPSTPAAEAPATEGVGYDKVIIGLDDTFAPMGFRDSNNELTGFDVELAKAVGEIIGVEIEFQPINWDMKETELINGNVDLLWNGYTITEERKKQLLFTNPYLNNRQIVLVLEESGIETMADLAGKTVATQAGSSSETAIDTKPDVKATFGEYVTFGTYDECLLDQEAGRTDAVVADEVLIRYYVANHPDTKYKVIDEYFTDEEYGIGARKEDTALVSAINDAITELKANGKGGEISTKWFQEDILQ